jgi:uncharacterized protein
MEEWNWNGQKLVLSPQRVLYWEAENTLIVSDLHLGKTGHFRKHGLAVPTAVTQEDLHRLWQSLQFFQPTTLLIVGDFVHSHANQELEQFARWRADSPGLKITLVKGNHDILPPAWYAQHHIAMVSHFFKSNLFFVHDAADANALMPDANTGIVSGHLHPAVAINAIARQRLRLPCFYFSGRHCILPAFSLFSGTAVVKPKPTDHIFAILPAGSSTLPGPSLLRL